MGKKPIVSVTYENERISIKNSLPYSKCVLRLSCVVYGPIYGRRMGFYVNGFLSTYKVYQEPINRLLGLYKVYMRFEILSFSKVTETIGFFPIQILILWMLRNNIMAMLILRAWLGYLWCLLSPNDYCCLYFVYGYFEKRCRKKCTRQSRKVTALQRNLKEWH